MDATGTRQWQSLLHEWLRFNDKQALAIVTVVTPDRANGKFAHDLCVHMAEQFLRLDANSCGAFEESAGRAPTEAMRSYKLAARWRVDW